MTPENLKPKFGNAQMKPISPKQIMRNLDHGYAMTHQEQREAAAYIRQLQQSNEALKDGFLKSAEKVVRLRNQFNLWNKGETWTSD